MPLLLNTILNNKNIVIKSHFQQGIVGEIFILLNKDMLSKRRFEGMARRSKS